MRNNGGYSFFSGFAIIQLEGYRRDMGRLLQHAQHLTGSFACPGDQRQHGNAEPVLKDVGVHLNTACLGDIRHIETQDCRLAVFEQLQGKQQVPFQLRGVNYIDKGFRGFFDQILCGYALIAGEGVKRVDSGQIDQLAGSVLQTADFFSTVTPAQFPTYS